MKQAVLKAIAEAWNNTGISYVVIHGLEDYPDHIGRDLDVVVQGNQIHHALKTASSISREMGFVTIVHKKPWAWWTVAIGFDRGPKAVEIDLILYLNWGWVELVSHPQPTHMQGPFKTDPWACFVKRILIQVLGGDFRKLREKPKELMLTEQEKHVAASQLVTYFGSRVSHRLLLAIDGANIEELMLLAPRLRRTILMRSLLKKPVRSFKATLRWARDKSLLTFLAKKCAPIIAVVGPDGIGKSTLIECLMKQVTNELPFTGVLERHWRPSVLPPLGNLMGRKQSGTGTTVEPRRTGGRFQALRLMYYFIDFVIGGWLKDRPASSTLQLILYDRCGLDMMVDPVRYGLSSIHGTRLLWRLVPKPDLVILLHDNPDSIHIRKPELQKVEIERQLSKWLELAEEGEVNAIIRVDASPEIIAGRVGDLITEAFVEENGGPVSDKSGHIQWLSAIVSNGQEASLKTEKKIVPEEHPGGANRTYSFGWLALKDGRGYLVPLDNRQVAGPALNLYNAQTFGSKLARRLVAIGLQTGIAQHSLSRVQLPNERNGFEKAATKFSLLEYLKQVIGRGDACFAFSLGTPGPHRKPVIQVLTPRGETLAYVKVGWNDATNALVQNEASILRQLASTSLTSFAIPRLLHAGWWNRCYLCVLSSPNVEVESAPKEMGPLYLKIIVELASSHIRSIPLKETSFWKDLSQRRDKVSNSYYEHVLGQGMRVVEERLNEVSLPFHFCHGDFAPWNAKRVNGNLFLFDWEYAQREAPAGWDLFHFLIQTQSLLKKEVPGQIVTSFQEGGKAHRWLKEFSESLALKDEHRRSLLILYLLERLSFYASNDNFNFKMLAKLSMMLNLCMYRGTR